MSLQSENVRFVQSLKPREATAAAPCCGGGQIMKHTILWSLMLTLCVAALHAAPQDSNPPMPRYAGQNLIRPENCREWIFLSSGLGMNYNPSPGAHEMFTNVFVPQWSYRPVESGRTRPFSSWRNEVRKARAPLTERGFRGAKIEFSDETAPRERKGETGWRRGLDSNSWLRFAGGSRFIGPQSAYFVYLRQTESLAAGGTPYWSAGCFSFRPVPEKRDSRKVARCTFCFRPACVSHSICKASSRSAATHLGPI
jgi:hypothetical protein